MTEEASALWEVAKYLEKMNDTLRRIESLVSSQNDFLEHQTMLQQERNAMLKTTIDQSNVSITRRLSI